MRPDEPLTGRTPRVAEVVQPAATQDREVLGDEQADEGSNYDKDADQDGGVPDRTTYGIRIVDL